MDAPTPDEQPPAAATPAVGRGSLTDALHELQRFAGDRPLSIGQAVEVLRERGIAMVLVVITLPFLLPIPLPGLSTPIGGAVALYGSCLALRRQPWLPGFITRRTLGPGFVDKLLRFGLRWAHRFEYFMRPRLRFMTWRGIDTLIGLCLIVSGVVLALPLPIPLTNSPPAIAVLLLLLGLIERDGVFVLVGQVISLLLLAVIVYVGYLIAVHGAGDAWQMMRSWFGGSA